MTYQVLARKWRPQEFDTVVGQEPVTRTLRNALERGKIGQAATALGLTIIVGEVSNPAEFDTAVARLLAQGVDAVIGFSPLVAVDFEDQPFVITLPKKSDPFGNPQLDPVRREDVPKFYADFYAGLVATSTRIIGDTEYVTAEDTWQFDDYSKYAADMFDAAAKKRRHDEVFPEECRMAYEMGYQINGLEISWSL